MRQPRIRDDVPESVRRADALRLEQRNAEIMESSVAWNDARLVDELRAELRAECAAHEDTQRELDALKEPLPMKVLRTYRDARTSVVDVSNQAAMLDSMGFVVGLRWARDERGIINGITIAILDEEPE